MKDLKKLVSVLLVSISAYGLIFAGPAKDDEYALARTRLLETLRNFDAIVMNANKASVVSDIYKETRGMLLEGKLVFAVNREDLPILDSLQVTYQKDKTFVSIGIAIFRQDTKTPGFLLGFVGQGLALARNGLLSGQNPYKPDDIQRIYDGMDALFMHAQFVKDFVSGSGREPLPLEQFLLDSLESDSLASLPPMASAAMMLLSLDAQILSSMAEHGGAAKQKIITSVEYVQKVRSLAERLYEAAEKANSDKSDLRASFEARYVSEVSSLTFLRFGAAIINDHLKRFYPGTEKEKATAAELVALNKAFDTLEAQSTANKGALGYRKVFLAGLGL